MPSDGKRYNAQSLFVSPNGLFASFFFHKKNEEGCIKSPVNTLKYEYCTKVSRDLYRNIIGVWIE